MILLLHDLIFFFGNVFYFLFFFWFVFLDLIETWGRTDNMCENNDHRDCG